MRGAVKAETHDAVTVVESHVEGRAPRRGSAVPGWTAGPREMGRRCVQPEARTRPRCNTLETQTRPLEARTRATNIGPTEASRVPGCPFATRHVQTRRAQAAGHVPRSP